MKKRLVLNSLMVLAALVLLLPLASASAQAPGFVDAKADGEPSVFPAEGISAPPYTPYLPEGGKGAGIESSNVTFNGLWDSSCKVYGTDAYHSSPTSYTAGTFRMTVDGVPNIQGYCIDVQHSVAAGNAWQASVYAAREEGLCEANWILANYNRTTPGPGLTQNQEGAAIQAAIWHFVELFQPAWNSSYWCGDYDVYQRTLDIIGQATGKCIAMPASLDLSASPTELPPGESSDLSAAVLDQKAQPFEGQTVDFATTVGTLDPTSDATDASGVANSTITHDSAATAQITASMSGSSATAAVDDLAGQKQRILIIKNIDYSDDDEVSVSWQRRDFGDAPDSYGTWRASDGPRHVLLPGGPVLGASVDAESDSADFGPDACACADDSTDSDDEDGVEFLTTLVPGQQATIRVIGTAGAKLDAWIDFGSTGNASDPNTFDAGDQIAASLVLNGSPQDITFDVPAGTPLVDTWARFRISWEGGLAPTGEWPNGEVEDYALRFTPTAVKLFSFEAKAQKNAIVLTWETASEIDNLGFNVYRAEAAEGAYSQLNASLIPSQVPPGSPVGAVYTFRDRTAQPGIRYFYKLESVDIHGYGALHGPVNALMRPRASEISLSGEK